MRVLFAAYRKWALPVVAELARHPNVDSSDLVSSIEDLEHVICRSNQKYDLVVLCGWSWQVSHELLNRVTVVSEHPAYLDEYSLGTPLQGQIVDGIEQTKHRVVKIGYPELGDRLYSPVHEVNMSLAGSMDDILQQMADTALDIYTKFLNDWPDIHWKRWPKCDAFRTPRKPGDSRLTRSDLGQLTSKQLYDRIRMLGDPYPNAFFEDEHGIVRFTGATFEPK